jgi:hypothetical protein
MSQAHHVLHLDVAEIKAVITLWVRPLMRIWIDRRLVVVVVTTTGFEYIFPLRVI